MAILTPRRGAPQPERVTKVPYPLDGGPSMLRIVALGGACQFAPGNDWTPTRRDGSEAGVHIDFPHPNMGSLDVLPVWATALLVAVALLAACEVGFRVAARAHDAEDSRHGNVLSATLALLALLVAFTFELALGRYEARRTVVLEEANAIGTAYLRAQIAPEPLRSRLSDQMRQYVDARLALAGAGEDRAAVARAEALAGSLQQQMWSTTVAVLPTVQPVSAAPLLAAAMNTVIDVAGARRSALAARLPRSVVAALLLYAFVAAGMLGFVTGGGRKRSRAPSFILLLLLTLALMLILDLDRARTGTITVSQAPLVDLRASIAPP
ncbi:MAG TPA: hypothetical protein VHQ45_06080 [Gemmatimonadaceae bacterium]|nr:hypothetical protein [Gemmatimonadaceae bacterium]